jgi:amidophosphoribosyltransferase
VTPGNPATIPVTEDPAERPGATGCDPGPDAEFEALLTDSDRVNTPDRSIAADKKEPV